MQAIVLPADNMALMTNRVARPDIHLATMLLGQITACFGVQRHAPEVFYSSVSPWFFGSSSWA
ncbi:hypothetical protein [Bartonella sp. MU70NMGDW]|uniref:hypothetical protein n=1 Tax=Bartonella sp. MU70NMGDW TaxID=3243561 RepID=UPI0035D0F6AB